MALRAQLPSPQPAHWALQDSPPRLHDISHGTTLSRLLKLTLSPPERLPCRVDRVIDRVVPELAFDDLPQGRIGHVQRVERQSGVLEH